MVFLYIHSTLVSMQGIAIMGRIIDDSLRPLHERLAKIYTSLRTLVSGSRGVALIDSSELIKLQQSLNALENGLSLSPSSLTVYKDHCINGKFVPLGCKVTDPVPAGQAVIATLVARCYRMIHSSYEGQSVDPVLMPIQEALLQIIDQLKFLVCIRHN